ncbi:hypothetical protein [Rhodococcus sp. NPDC059234]|uniref:hypothetical protein n=1 Tax=Rhodococcus sp. NPDC059234 TaxID=3346781 RepID=UPI00366D0957
MTTLSGLAVLTVLLAMVLLPASRWSRRARPPAGNRYRVNMFRPDHPLGSVGAVDRDAERASVDLEAVRRRSPHR